MVVIPGLEEILALIVSNPAKALLLVESLKLAKQLSDEHLKKIAEKFKDIQKLKKFGCTPSDELAKNLIKIDSTPKFLQLKKLIGKHQTLKLARIGLYLGKLNLEGVKSVVDEIRNEIIENHGYDGAKLINMGSSGILSESIDALQNVKDEFNLSKSEVIIEYEYSIKKIEYISIWIKSEDVAQNIKIKIINKMEDMRPRLFYVIATGLASSNTAQVIAEMCNKNEIRKRGYMVFSPRIVPFGDATRQYLWTFYSFVQ